MEMSYAIRVLEEGISRNTEKKIERQMQEMSEYEHKLFDDAYTKMNTELESAIAKLKEPKCKHASKSFNEDIGGYVCDWCNEKLRS